MLGLLLLAHALAGLGILGGARRLGRRAFVIGGLAPLAVVSWAATQAGDVTGGGVVTDRWEWVPRLGLAVDLRLDGFALLMVVLVSGIGALVFAYGWSYFGGAESAGRAAALLTLFAGSMLGVVLADNLLLLYVCWELTSITSYLLIGLDDAESEARSAALHALLVTGAGGLAMLGGFVAIGQDAGTYRISEILASPPSGTATSVGLVLVLAGAFTKSAQYPFHGWLPGAMVAPTPISAYLHSAAMVKAGVYLIARLAPAFADVGVWRPLVVAVGLTTMVAGGLRALRPFDLKQLLAFGTISQLGFMVVLLGVGIPEATTAGCALLLAHGLFKAALFMVVGVVDHELHTRDIRILPTLDRRWSVVRITALVSAASMAAVPPLAGFIAKEEAYAAFVDGSSGDRGVLAGIVLGSVLTAAYSARFAVALVRPDLVAPHEGTRPVAEHAPRWPFVAPAAVLATATAVLGLVPFVWSDLVDTAAHTLDEEAHAHLALWHGFEPALWLSLLTLAAGTVLFLARDQVARVQSRLAPPVSGVEAYDAIVRWVLAAASRITSVVQSGSLPIYVGIILTTAALAPAVALLGGGWWSGWPDVATDAAHLPVAVLLVVGAVAAAVARRRFSAALLLGVVGYGMAVLFVLLGAPDLALTQVAVETLSVVVFLLVLRRLPDRFEHRPPAIARIPRLAVSLAVGAFVVLMGLAFSTARTEAPVSREMSERALSDGDGKNVVNVILVDIRGMDTLGEVTVLVAAAIGITALVRAGARGRRAEPGPETDPAAQP